LNFDRTVRSNWACAFCFLSISCSHMLSFTSSFTLSFLLWLEIARTTHVCSFLSRRAQYHLYHRYTTFILVQGPPEEISNAQQKAVPEQVKSISTPMPLPLLPFLMTLNPPISRRHCKRCLACEASASEDKIAIRCYFELRIPSCYYTFFSCSAIVSCIFRFTVYFGNKI
jgi:hypothetical protein